MALGFEIERESSPLVRALAGSAVSLLLLDRHQPDPRIVFASSGFERLTGYARRDVVDQSLRILDGPQTAETTSEYLANALRNARRSKVVIQHHRKSGEAFWDEVSLSPLRDADGDVSHLVCVQLDVTPQVESDFALRESFRRICQAKNEWESTVDSLLELVLLVDADMRVIRANRTVESWGLGSVDTIRDQDFHDVLHPDCARPTCHILDLWRRSNEAGIQSDAATCNANDESLKRRVQVTMRALQDWGGVGGLDPKIVIVRDASDVYETEETKRRKDRFEAMGFLIGGLAHEIGNPIAAMKTTLDVWDRSFEGFDPETHRRYLKRTQDGVDRLRATIDRILGREQGETRTDEIIEVAPLLARVHGLFEAQAKESGVTLDCDGISDPSLSILGDASAIDEVLANLTKNAIEACTCGNRIWIDAECSDDHVTIRIRDNGPGIESSDMEHLFVPFFTTKPTGTGLGLAHVNRLVGEMGGQIEIKSAESGGTTGTVRFRRADANGT